MDEYQLGRDLEAVLNRLDKLERSVLGCGPGATLKTNANVRIGYHGKIDGLEHNQFQWQPYAIKHPTWGYGIKAIQFIGEGVEIHSLATNSGGQTFENSQTQWTGDPDGPHHLSKISVDLRGPNRDRFDVWYQVIYHQLGLFGPVSNGTMIANPNNEVDQIHAFQAWILPKSNA